MVTMMREEDEMALVSDRHPMSLAPRGRGRLLVRTMVLVLGSMLGWPLGGCGDNDNNPGETTGSGGEPGVGGLSAGAEGTSIGGTSGLAGGEAVGVGGSATLADEGGPLGDYFNQACPNCHRIEPLNACRRCIVEACSERCITMYEEGSACPNRAGCLDRCTCGTSDCFAKQVQAVAAIISSVSLDSRAG